MLYKLLVATIRVSNWMWRNPTDVLCGVMSCAPEQFYASPK